MRRCCSRSHGTSPRYDLSGLRRPTRQSAPHPPVPPVWISASQMLEIAAGATLQRFLREKRRTNMRTALAKPDECGENRENRMSRKCGHRRSVVGDQADSGKDERGRIAASLGRCLPIRTRCSCPADPHSNICSLSRAMIGRSALSFSRSAQVAENATSRPAMSNSPSAMPTMTGRSKTGLLGAILTTGFSGTGDMNIPLSTRIRARVDSLTVGCAFRAILRSTLLTYRGAETLFRKGRPACRAGNPRHKIPGGGRDISAMPQ